MSNDERKPNHEDRMTNRCAASRVRLRSCGRPWRCLSKSGAELVGGRMCRSVYWRCEFFRRGGTLKPRDNLRRLVNGGRAGVCRRWFQERLFGDGLIWNRLLRGRYLRTIGFASDLGRGDGRFRRRVHFRQRVARGRAKRLALRRRDKRHPRRFFGATTALRGDVAGRVGRPPAFCAPPDPADVQIDSQPRTFHGF
jgi:hypothetical protein